MPLERFDKLDVNVSLPEGHHWNEFHSFAVYCVKKKEILANTTISKRWLRAYQCTTRNSALKNPRARVKMRYDACCSKDQFRSLASVPRFTLCHMNFPMTERPAAFFAGVGSKPAPLSPLSLFSSSMAALVATVAIRHCLDEIISAVSREVKGFCKSHDCKKRDYGDFEWDAVAALFWSMRYWFMAHFVIGQLIATFAERFLQHFYVAYSLLFMALCFPRDVWARVVTMATASCIAVLLRRRSLAYVTGSAIVIITTLPLPFIPHIDFSPCVIGGNRSFEASIFFTGWSILRWVSVAADLIDRPPSERKDARKTVLRALAYALYFPGLIAGPVTNYDDFMTESYRRPTWNRKRILEFAVRSARVALGYCAMEGLLRLAYVRSAALSPRWLQAQSGWTLAGIVYFSALQFYLEYNFAYGIPSLFFWLDGVYERHDLRPRCTARIHTAANTWRYIYKALIADHWTAWRRFLGTSASFAFVLLWHTTQHHMVVWVVTNYVLVMAEMLCAGLATTAPVKAWRATRHGPLAETVLKGALSALNLVGAYGSSFFFLTDYDIARRVLGKLLVFPYPLLPVLLALYCNAQVAMDIFEWESARRRNKTSRDDCQLDTVDAPSSSPCPRRKYIYKALIADHWTAWRRFLGTSASFAFVLLWHTTQHHMVVWVVTNYVLVMAEMLCAGLATTPPVKAWRATRHGPLAETVLKGALSALNLVGAYGSSFFFLTDYDIARRVLGKLLVFPYPLLPVLLALYCNAQVAMDIFEWESSRRRNKTSRDDCLLDTVDAPSSSPCPRRKYVFQTDI
ncbi:hypothetical protein HPB50_025347 [Hyalomma asiaticum]|uniref:Uncharacterized protein n=1 Tax=Hyalomma asiaticum TaxID=266040 RepID=A0ACB7RVS3_HYAAI|nr:hypothetical protein HPB50_025347 [Hyalomma asiaticum]